MTLHGLLNLNMEISQIKVVKLITFMNNKFIYNKRGIEN